MGCLDSWMSSTCTPTVPLPSPMLYRCLTRMSSGRHSCAQLTFTSSSSDEMPHFHAQQQRWSGGEPHHRLHIPAHHWSPQRNVCLPLMRRHWSKYWFMGTGSWVLVHGYWFMGTVSGPWVYGLGIRHPRFSVSQWMGRFREI